VTKGEANCKIWLEPVIIAYMHDFSSSEEREIMEIIIIHTEQFKKKWNEYFGK
jgi:hypothetical protein